MGVEEQVLGTRSSVKSVIRSRVFYGRGAYSPPRRHRVWIASLPNFSASYFPSFSKAVAYVKEMLADPSAVRWMRGETQKEGCITVNLPASKKPCRKPKVKRRHVNLAPLPPGFYKNMQRWRIEDRRTEKRVMLRQLSELVCPRRSFVKILDDILEN